MPCLLSVKMVRRKHRQIPLTRGLPVRFITTSGVWSLHQLLTARWRVVCPKLPRTRFWAGGRVVRGAAGGGRGWRTRTGHRGAWNPGRSTTSGGFTWESLTSCGPSCADAPAWVMPGWPSTWSCWTPPTETSTSRNTAGTTAVWSHL